MIPMTEERRRHMQETQDKVEAFLEQVKEILKDDENWNINDEPWVGKVNKTLRYMTEKNLEKKDIKPIIEELKLENYSATKLDTNSNFKGEYIWEFGITKTVVDDAEDLYIKLKIRNLGDDCLLVMSFHPEEPNRPEKKLQFPYKTQKQE